MMRSENNSPRNSRGPRLNRSRGYNQHFDASKEVGNAYCSTPTIECVGLRTPESVKLSGVEMLQSQHSGVDFGQPIMIQGGSFPFHNNIIDQVHYQPHPFWRTCDDLAYMRTSNVTANFVDILGDVNDGTQAQDSLLHKDFRF